MFRIIGVTGVYKFCEFRLKCYNENSLLAKDNPKINSLFHHKLSIHLEYCHLIHHSNCFMYTEMEKLLNMNRAELISFLDKDYNAVAQQRKLFVYSPLNLKHQVFFDEACKFMKLNLQSTPEYEFMSVNRIDQLINQKYQIINKLDNELHTNISQCLQNDDFIRKYLDKEFDKYSKEIQSQIEIVANEYFPNRLIILKVLFLLSTMSCTRFFTPNYVIASQLQSLSNRLIAGIIGIGILKFDEVYDKTDSVEFKLDPRFTDYLENMLDYSCLSLFFGKRNIQETFRNIKDTKTPENLLEAFIPNDWKYLLDDQSKYDKVFFLGSTSKDPFTIKRLLLILFQTCSFEYLFRHLMYSRLVYFGGNQIITALRLTAA